MFFYKMQFKKPKFWSSNKPNFLAIILLPFTLVLILNNFILNLRKKIKSTHIKSICVGNIYLGGTGKTPLVIKLYDILDKANIRAVTAKKDYKNQLDEQIILREKTKLILSSSRLQALKKAIQDSNEFIIFDDGLQDNNIDYDIKFVCFKIKSWIGNGCLIPAGPLRENIHSLKKYDAVFLNGKKEFSGGIEKTIYKINPKIKIFYTYYEPVNLEKLDLKKEYIIFSGIGEPDDFKEILISNKFKVSKEIIYPDHFQYSQDNLEYILKEAKKTNAEIITTEKDYNKISENYKKYIKFLQIDLKICDENNLKNYLIANK